MCWLTGTVISTLWPLCLLCSPNPISFLNFISTAAGWVPLNVRKHLKKYSGSYFISKLCLNYSLCWHNLDQSGLWTNHPSEQHVTLTLALVCTVLCRWERFSYTQSFCHSWRWGFFMLMVEVSPISTEQLYQMQLCHCSTVHVDMALIPFLCLNSDLLLSSSLICFFSFLYYLPIPGLSLPSFNLYTFFLPSLSTFVCHLILTIPALCHTHTHRFSLNLPFLALYQC